MNSQIDVVEHSEYQKEIDKAIDEKLSVIKDKKYSDNIILVFGSFPLWNENICKYIDNLSKKMVTHKIIVVSEGLNLNENDLNEKYSCEYIQIPPGIEHGKTASDGKVSLNDDEKKEILSRNYLKHLTYELKCQMDSFGTDNANQFVIWINKFYSSLLEIIKPERILMWNEYFPNHFVLNHIAQEKNIPVFIMEYGLMTGTYSIDFIGSFGKSYPSVCSKQFQKIKISKEEFLITKQFIDEQRNGGYNQYAQPETNLEELNKIKGKKPIITYIGAVHSDSGFVLGEEGTYFNSPLFSSDIDTLVFLRNICDVNDWLLIHKPHPNCIYDYHLKNVVFVEKCNINDLIDISDVLITVSSKVSYQATIRNKPTVSLGYTHINFKNIVYEAYEKYSVEKAINDALLNGLTEEMKNNFIKHIAQIRHYLFDNTLDKPWKFGLPLCNAASLIESSLKDSDYIIYDDEFKYKVKTYKKEIKKRQNNH